MSGEGVGIGILDANGRSIDPYSGRSNMKRSHHGLTINTSNPASNSTDSQMSSYPTSSSSLGSHSHSMDESDHMHSHQGLAGVGLMGNFNTNMFNAVNTPLPPSPAVQTPNSAISNHFMFQHLNNQQVDSPVTPICPQFVHQDGFGGNHFSNNNSNQSLTLVDGSNAFNHQINGMDHHHHHHLDPNSTFGRSNSMDEVQGRFSKVMRTDNLGTTLSSSSIGNALMSATNSLQNERRSSYSNGNSMLHLGSNSNSPRQISAPNSPGGTKRKSPAQ